jgi:hypothetical protein
LVKLHRSNLAITVFTISNDLLFCYISKFQRWIINKLKIRMHQSIY